VDSCADLDGVAFAELDVREAVDAEDGLLVRLEGDVYGLVAGDDDCVLGGEVRGDGDDDEVAGLGVEDRSTDR
jgi:hypothetical protein